MLATYAACGRIMTVRPAGLQPCHSVRALADLPQRLGSEYASIEVRRSHLQFSRFCS